MIISDLNSLKSHLYHLWDMQHFPHLLLLETRQNHEAAENILSELAKHILQTQVLTGHAGFFSIKPEGIDKEKLQRLRQFLQHTSVVKFAIIEQVNLLHINGINSLLKIFEEAPAMSYIMLISSNIYRLPAVLRSRCHCIIWRTPDSTSNIMEQIAVAITKNDAPAFQRLCHKSLNDGSGWEDFTCACLAYLQSVIKNCALGTVGPNISLNHVRQHPLQLLDKMSKLRQLLHSGDEYNLNKKYTAMAIYQLLR